MVALQGHVAINPLGRSKGGPGHQTIALILIAASELDHVDPSTEEKRKPLSKVLDKACALPCHVFWLLTIFLHYGGGQSVR